MACYYPLQVWKRPGGGINFSKAGSWEDLPMTIACGTCSGCRLERSRQWAVRMVHEASLRDQNCFLTLTYNNQNLPAGGTVLVEHWQHFAKKLRNKAGPFRFFHCGEYGSKKGRPHYHAIIFGLDFRKGSYKCEDSKSGFPQWGSPLIDKCWKYGTHTIGDMTFKTAAYVARYLMAKKNGKGSEEHYHGRTPEYTTMSRRPGIGKGWFDKFHTDVFPADHVIINGVKAGVPRYYDRLLEKQDPDMYKEVQKQRRIKATRHTEDQTPERLKVKEKVQDAKQKLFTRRDIDR